MTPEEKRIRNLGYQKTYRERHKDKVNLYHQEYREKNRDRIRAIGKAYLDRIKADPVKYKEYLAKKSSYYQKRKLKREATQNQSEIS